MKNPHKTNKGLFERFEQNFCQHTSGQEAAIQQGVFDIYKKVTSYDAFYDILGMPKKSFDELNALLKQAVKNSKAKKYHGTIDEMIELPPTSEQLKLYEKNITKVENFYEVKKEKKDGTYKYQVSLKTNLKEEDWKALAIKRWDWLANEV